MKVRILARRLEDGSKVPTGEIRVEELPEKQRLNAATLEKFADHFTIEEDKFTLSTVDGKIIFHIKHHPGRYCITCGTRLPDFGGNGRKIETMRAKQCRDHVATHGKEAMKSEKWPHGYVNRPNTYTCTVEDKRGH